MDVRGALREQYHAGLLMLFDCVALCPDDLWTAPNPPSAVSPRPENPDWNGVSRPYWRIAFHNAYFTHLYLGQGEGAFQPPPPDLAVRRREDFADMWRAPWALEPYELPSDAEPCTQAEIIEYIRFVDALIDPTLEGLDLDSPESGFHWYKEISKLSHELMNLRHLQGHVGQLSELLMLRGIDIEWPAKATALP